MTSLYKSPLAHALSLSLKYCIIKQAPKQRCFLHTSNGWEVIQERERDTREEEDSQPFRVNNSGDKDNERIWQFFDNCSSTLQPFWIGIQSATLALG